MAISSVENVCYNNPVYEGTNHCNIEPSVSIGKAPGEQVSAQNLKKKNWKLLYLSLIHI